LSSPKGQPSRVGTGAFLGGKYSVNDVIAFGGISEVEARGFCSSNRIRDQPNADLTQMERAQQQASTRGPSSYSGTKNLPYFTFASFSDESRANKFGVSLGVSNNEVIESITLLKDMDVARTLFVLKHKEVKNKEKMTSI
jgi:hypothetical protein